MAVLDDDLILNNSLEGDPVPKLALGTPELMPMPNLPSLGNVGMGGGVNSSREGLDGSQLSKIAKLPGQGGGANLIPLSEVVANKRYNTYVRGMDLENIYGMQQSAWAQLGNSAVKMAGLAVGTFAQSFATIPDTISALKNRSFADLSGGPDSYESAIDDWTKNLEDYFPNYYTRKERESPYLAMIPFMPGSANFWGDKIFKNLGFTAGAIGGALVQDAIIGSVTSGIGAAPIIAGQLGKASLALNKLYAGTTKVDRVLDLARTVGKTEQQILNIKRLGEIAAGTKITNGFRYGMSLYGSSRTEAAIEARDGFRQVKDELLRQYKIENPGKEPIGADLEEIEKYATDAMNTRFGINMALLTVSNAVQFDNLFKSFTSAQKGLTGQLTRDIDDVGKIGLKEGSIDVFETKGATTLSGKIWESVQPKIPNILAEGVYEEGGQYAAEKGTYDYFTRKYKNLSDPLNKDNWSTTVEAVNSTMKGLKDQFGTDEGLENMIIGAISAMITGGAMSKIDQIKGDSSKQRLNDAVNILNQYGLTGTLSGNFDNTLNSAGIAKEMQEAAKSGDVYKYKNLKDDMFFNYVQSRNSIGMHDVTIEQLRMLKDLDKEEFQKTFGMDFDSSNKSTVNEYVDSLISQANEIKKISDSIDATFKNPFTQIINPKTEEEGLQNAKFYDFNNWKTELKRLSTKIPHINDRLNSIQESVSAINPAVTNDLISQLTNKDSLKELSSFYEQKANQLNKTITEFTSPSDKKNIKDQVKALRTASERINLGLSSNVDNKLFDYLLNFELNNQNPSASRVVGPEWSADLFTYGHDINRLNITKDRVSELFDDLTSEQGFNKFMEQGDQLRSGAVPEEEETEEPEVKEGAQFTNKGGVKELFEKGREYQIPSGKKARVDKIADDRWQVTAPDGNITFYPSKERADEAVDDINSEFGNLQKVKVVDINPDGTIKVEDINGDIYNVDLSKFDGYEKIESEQEKLQKFKQDIEDDQNDIEHTSGTSSSKENTAKTKKEFEVEGAKKGIEWLFVSTSGASEDWESGKLSPSQQRAIVFRNNYKSLPNRANLRILLVTQNQEASLGLSGLTALSMAGTGVDPSEYTDMNDGFIGAVYVEQEGDDVYFVDQYGKKLGKVGQPVDINTVVFDTMPTTSLTWSNKENRYRDSDESKAKEYQTRWRTKRKELLNLPESKYEIYKFSVSPGIPEITNVSDNNSVGETLISENEIPYQEGLIVIPTTGTIQHQGRNLKFPDGVPVFQYRDVVTFLKTRKFTKAEVRTVFEVMKKMSEDLKKQIDNGKKKKINRKYSTFLQNVLYWRKSPKTDKNQIYIDIDKMDFFFGGKRYDLTNLAASEAEIVEQLENVYANINNDSLTKNFSNKFDEYYINDNGELVTRKWDNYQSYLLSSSYPDGSKRAVENIPLTTPIQKPTELKPFNFKQKYSILEGVELPVVSVAPVAPAPVATAPSGEKIGDYIVDGTTKNVYQLKNGPVGFTASVKDGAVIVDVESNDTIKKIAENKTVVQDTIIPLLKSSDRFIATETDEEYVLGFVALKISSDLQKQLNVSAAPAPAAPVVSDKKADRIIEAKFIQQETEFYIEVKGENRDFLLTWSRNSNKPTLWGEKQPDGTYKATLEYPSEKNVQDLVDKYVPKSLLNLINKWTEASKLPAGEVLDAQDKIAKEIKTELAAVAEAPAPTAAVLQPDVSPLAEAQGTARTEPVVTAVSDIEANQLTVEEADWLYNNIKQITDKYNSSTLADSADPNLKTPLKFGDTTVTAIEPRAGDKSYIWFERPTGKWLISIDERDGKQYLTLSKLNDKGTYYAQSISEEELQKLVDTSGLRSLIDSIYKDTNIKQPETRRDQFEAQNALQQKYGLKRTYKDIVKELAALEGAKPAGTVTKIGPGTSVKINTSDASFNVNLKTFKQSGDNVELSYVNRYNVQIGYKGKVKNGILYPRESFNPKSGWKPLSTATFIRIELPTISTEAKPAESPAVEAVKTYWTSSTPESIKKELVNDPQKSVTSDIDEPGFTVRFAYYQNEDRAEQVIVPGFEDYDEVDVVEMPKGNYFTVENGFGEVETFHENNPKLDERIKSVIDYNKKLEKPAAPKNFSGTKPPPNSEYRRVGADGIERISSEELDLFKAWAAENVPTIPYEVTENILITHDNEKAWGAFENGVAKFYRSAARGTEYHEIGEAVWNGMLSSEEQQAILAEERTRAGKFKDRQSGKIYSYDDPNVTDQMLKERIMDDFAEFRLGKLPARSLKEKVLRFFRNIIEFFKQFVQKPSKKQELFKAIDTGRFKEKVISESAKNAFAEYRAVEGLTEEQTHEFVQDITARVFQIAFGTNMSLYNPEQITAPQIFAEIKEMYQQEGKLDLLSENAWRQLISKTRNFLRTFKIEFDEEGVLGINDENYNKNDYAREAFSTDWKKSSPFPIKLILGTMTEVVPTSQIDTTSLDLPKQKLSSVNGYKLLNFARTFATAMDKFANTNSVTKLVDKLIELSRYDGNYVRLFTRLKGDRNTVSIDFSKFEDQDWRLFINFYQTFTKQKPNAVIQYVGENNEVYNGAANLFSAVEEYKRGWIENIRTLANDNKSLIYYYSPDKTFRTKKLDSISIGNPQEMVEFLGNIGINFPFETYQNLKVPQQKAFARAVSAIKKYASDKEIGKVTGETLTINGQLNILAELYIRATNPNMDSTYFGVDGKRQQSYADSNAPSVFENTFNEVETLDELLSLRPELKDVFSANSVILEKGGPFFDKNGKRTDKQLKVGYIQGTKNTVDDKGVPTSRLTLGQRFTQEFNQNILGNYYIVIPADGSTEWMLNFGNHVTFADFETGESSSQVHYIFRKYLEDEIALALSDRSYLTNVAPRAKELRFFKDILSDNLLTEINSLIEKGDKEKIKEFIDANISDINSSVDAYIESTVSDSIADFKNNKQVYYVSDEVLSFPGLNDAFAKEENLDKYNLSEDELNTLFRFANTNYIINNIEFHKILFGDPYQFKIKDNQLDETKRIKSFLSPRRVTFDSPEFNTWLNSRNKAGEIPLSPEDPGYHLHKSYTPTVTVADVNIVGSIAMMKDINKDVKDAYAKTNEADAGSILKDTTYREIKLKNGQWPTEAENWHQWQMAYTRNKMAAKGLYKYTNDSLRKQDENKIASPAPKYTIEVLKPIVTGSKHNKNTIDLVLDKFSQMPLYYSMVEGTNLENLYMKMMKEDVGYIVMISGRKVGAEGLHSLYNSKGEFNEEAFNNRIEVPWKAYGIQVETTTEDDKYQTRGSQLTKMSSMDLYSNGAPLAKTPERQAVIKKAYDRNKDILDKMHANSYRELLNKLGLEDLGDSFKVIDNTKVSETLEYEMLRREMSDNAIDTVKLDENNQFRVPFESSPAYIQIRNILFSIIDKSFISPKMSGGAHVQVPVTMWESATKGRSLALKTKDGWQKITKQEYDNLSEEDKKKVALTDDTLKFYTKEDPYSEVMLPHWFKDKFPKNKFKTDEDILNYLNRTEEGKKILTGIGFRIPTQATSSVEVFRVKAFLPKYMGATVVVPSEITTKAGSDFDIDKLNMYLKSVYVDARGDVKLVKYLGSEGKTKQFYREEFDRILEGKTFKKAELLEALDILTYELDDPKGLVKRYGNLLDSMLQDYNDASDLAADLMKDLEKLGDESAQADFKEKFANQLYKQSLENEYYESLEELLTLPEVFGRLISPVGDAGLKDLSERLDTLRGTDEGKIKNRLLNRSYMTSLRHAFVSAKKWVGIAAVNITGHSLFQKTQIYIDPSKFELQSKRDKEILGDGSIVLPHNKVNVNGKEYVSLSGALTADDSKEFISDRLSGYGTSFVDVAKDPYIMKIIKSELVVGTFMFLERIGAGEKAAFFLNQPIIDNYLTQLDSISYKNLFNKKHINTALAHFPAKGETFRAAGIDVDSLEDNIKKYNENGGKFNTDIENAVQQKIFFEFLKYAKMAEFNYMFSQAYNYDTTRFKSGDALFKKQTRTQQTRDKNILSSVDKVLDNSFIGEQVFFIDKSTEGLGEFLKLENPSFRIITDSVLKPFAENQYLSADDYERIGNKITSSFLDFIIQTKTPISSEIKALLVDPATSVAMKLAEAQAKYPENKLLSELQVVSSDRFDGAKSIKLRVNEKDAYSENLYQGMFRELRDNPETNALYNDIVKLSILQGTYQSAISIRNVIPIEDFAKMIAPVIRNLVATPELNAFSSGLFQRNNWKNSDVWRTASPKFFAQDFPIGQIESPGGDIIDIYQYSSPAFPDIPNLNIKGNDRKILTLNEAYHYLDVQNDFVLIPAVVTDMKTGEMIEVKTGTTMTRSMIAQMKAKGDMSYKNVYGYQKVRYTNGDPLLTYDKDGNPIHIYKLINLYGDGAFASEYYDVYKPSVFDNGTEKIDNEIPNGDIINHFAPRTIDPKPVAPVQQASISNIKKTVKEFKVGDQVQDDKYNVWKIISQEEYQKESRIGTKAGVKVRFVTNVNPNENRRQDVLNPDSTTYIEPNSVNTLGENTIVQSIPIAPVQQAPAAVSDERKAFIEKRISKLEQDIENGVAGPETYSDIDKYKKELGLTLEYGLTAANFEFPEGYDEAMAAEAVSGPSSETKINIYAGTGENADLSNFANRPFNYNGQKFTSVEQAFQYAKGEFYNVYEIDPNSNKTPADLEAVVDSHLANILKAKTGAEAKALGRKNIGVGFENSMWDGESSNIMKALLTESFKQNPDALAKLLATGNATLTHTQDKGKWGKEFPKLLMEVREELRSSIQDRGSAVRYIGPQDEDLKTGDRGITNGSYYEGYVNVKFESGREIEIKKSELELVKEPKKKELFSFEKGIAQKSFRGKPLNFVDKIPTQKETVVAMSNNRQTGIISIDQNAMVQKFNDKAWTKPAKQLDGSFATPLAENEFKSPEEWFTFALIHEVKHDTILKEPGETTGQYEDRINQAALEDLRSNYTNPPIVDQFPNKDLNIKDQKCN